MHDELDNIINEAARQMYQDRVEIPSPKVVLQAVFDALDRKKKRRFLFLLWLFAGLLLPVLGMLIYPVIVEPSQKQMTHQKQEYVPEKSRDMYTQSSQGQTSEKNEVSATETYTNGQLTEEKPAVSVHRSSSGDKQRLSPGQYRSRVEQSKNSLTQFYVSHRHSATGNMQENSTSAKYDPPVESIGIRNTPVTLLSFRSSWELPVFQPGMVPAPGKKPAENKVRFSVGVFSSLLFTMYDISASPSTGGYKDHIKKNNAVIPSFDAGIVFGLEKKRFVFETALSYSRYTYRQNLNDLLYPVFPVPPDSHFVSAIHQFELSAMAGCQFSFGRFYITPMAGVSAGIVQREPYYILEPDTMSFYLVFNTQSLVSPAFHVYVKADFRYRILPAFSVALSPVFRYNVTGYAEPQESLRFRPFSPGLRLGLHYHF